MLRGSFKPDFGYSDIGGHQLDYIHRRTDDTDIYYVVNRLDQPCRTECGFRSHRRNVELWDPVTGAIEVATLSPVQNEFTNLDIDLPANGSVFVILRDEATPGAVRGVVVERVAWAVCVVVSRRCREYGARHSAECGPWVGRAALAF